jgi:hypothetical protein
MALLTEDTAQHIREWAREGLWLLDELDRQDREGGYTLIRSESPWVPWAVGKK